MWQYMAQRQTEFWVMAGACLWDCTSMEGPGSWEMLLPGRADKISHLGSSLGSRHKIWLHSWEMGADRLGFRGSRCHWGLSATHTENTRSDRGWADRTFSSSWWNGMVFLHLLFFLRDWGRTLITFHCSFGFYLTFLKFILLKYSWFTMLC